MGWPAGPRGGGDPFGLGGGTPGRGAIERRAWTGLEAGVGDGSGRADAREHGAAGPEAGRPPTPERPDRRVAAEGADDADRSGLVAARAGEERGGPKRPGSRTRVGAGGGRHLRIRPREGTGERHVVPVLSIGSFGSPGPARSGDVGPDRGGGESVRQPVPQSFAGRGSAAPEPSASTTRTTERVSVSRYSPGA